MESISIPSPSSTILVIINFVNTALGGALGLMGNIFSASKLGIVWFIIGSLISCILTHFSIQFLCRSAELSQSLSTHNLAKSYFGSKGSLLTKIFVCLGNWSFIVNIIQIFADFAPQILRHWFHNNSFATTRWFAVIIGLILIFPWILVKNISKLEKLSTLCLGFAMFIFIVLIMNATKCISENNINDNVEIFVTDPYNIFLGLPCISWCWSLQFNAIPIYLTLHPDTRLNKINKVSLWSVFILFILYGTQGVAFYIVWADSINKDFITNLDNKNSNYIFYFDSWLSTLTQFIISIACFFSIPIFAFESRTNLHAIIRNLKELLFRKTEISLINESTQDERVDSNVLYENEYNDYSVDDINCVNNVEDRIVSEERINENEMGSFLSRLIEGSVICISAALVAMLISDLNLCLSLAGATYGCYISYFLPSGVYIIAVNKFDARQLTNYDVILKYIAIISILYGVVVCIAGILTAFT
eukprot:533792_1